MLFIIGQRLNWTVMAGFDLGWSILIVTTNTYIWLGYTVKYVGDSSKGGTS